ncbi:MAG: ubiquinol-cytochrome c reductase iron-sulfur subunit [bacterium]|nr:ubiquinol-cytochrome c reductase iron-sulfur subunit [bacterium]
MSFGQAFALGIGIVAVLSSIAIFALAWRRENPSASVGILDKEAGRRTKRRPSFPSGTASPSREEAAQADVSAVTDEPAGAPKIIELSATEFGETRRQFLNRATGWSFGAFLAFFGLTSLAFMWPKLKGGFGGKIDAGDVSAIKEAIFQPDGSIEPFYVAEAKTYVVPFDEAAIAETDFDGIDVVVDGLTGLWQKCPHLGCRVPWCSSSQGFECPCHGSKYNAAGEYEAGPAPRNLDRFTLEVINGRLIINTGSVRDTPRATVKTVQYPQGVSCL